MLASPINPFITGGSVPVSKFIGRRKEINSILSQLARPDVRGSSAISGEPRIGKTSLLDYISDSEIAGKYDLTSDRCVFVRIDGQALDKYMQDQGLQILTDYAFWHYILRSLSADKTYVAELTRKLHDQDSINIFDLTDLFDEVASKKTIVVLLLDEFDWIIAHIDRQRPTLLNTLRALINRQPAKRGLAVIISCQEPLHILCKDIGFAGSPFPNSLTPFRLRRFSTQEAPELIKGYLEGTGVSFTKDDVECVMRISGCHPYFLQLACSYLFEVYREKKGISKVDQEEAWRTVEENLRMQAESHFTYYWKHSSEDEQGVLTTLAQRSRVRGLRALIVNIRYRAFSRHHALTSLVNRGIVVKLANSHEIFSPLFARWILSQQLTVKGETPGSSVTNNKEKPITRPTVFVSYSHKDEKEKDALLSHLGVLVSADLIDLWSDDRIGAGADWETEINQAIAKAKVAILLISANFLTSKFILEKEVPELLKRRDREGLTVFPVIAKECAWKKVDWLAKMNVRPKNGNPVWSDGGSHVDKDLAAIAEEVEDIVRRTG